LGADSIKSCSVCGGSFAEWGIRQVWLSAKIATDVLPLLVNACSAACIEALLPGANQHVQVPHADGTDVVQPEDYYARFRR
jgi:hypothetical protein